MNITITVPDIPWPDVSWASRQGLFKDSLRTSFQDHLYFTLLVIFLVYLVSTIIYRLYLSPVSHIPGPRLAALTWWYEFYYDIILGGQYVFKIIDLHREYGPIVRINPCEVHIGDADYFPHVYPNASNRRRDRWEFYAQQFGAPGISSPS